MIGDGLSILHVVAPASTGGLERVVHALAGGSVRRGHRVTVAVVMDLGDSPTGVGGAEHPFVAGFVGTGVNVTTICLPPRRYWRERSAVATMCGRLRPCVVHTHGYRPDVVDAGVAQSAGVPTVTTVHGFTGGGWRNRVYEALQRRSWRRFDAVVAVSSLLGERIAAGGVARSNVHVIPNAYAPLDEKGATGARRLYSRAEARDRLGVSNGEFTIGWVGRLSPEKGLDTLLDALAALRESGGPAHATLVVLGDGQERSRLEAHAEAHGTRDAVRWLGVVPDAPRLYPGFDVFVLSSRTEGTPIALFEAMDAGVPIVATTVGGVPDVVTPAEARLVPPEDPAALAEGIRDVWRNPDAAGVRAGAARRRLADRYAIEPWLDRYETVYRAVIARVPRDLQPPH